jgi:hypothetical protein
MSHVLTGLQCPRVADRERESVGIIEGKLILAESPTGVCALGIPEPDYPGISSDPPQTADMTWAVGGARRG